MKYTMIRSKKILAYASTMAVLCSLALAGCQKNEIDNPAGQNDGIVKYAVAFGDGPQSKGALVNTTGNNDKTLDDFTEIVKEFKVEAYSGSSTEASFSQTVTWDDSKWVADPVEYWPQATSLKFFAYANTPSSTIRMNAERTADTLVYTVPSDASKHQDILLGYYYGNGGNKGIAEIRFNHPLTAVRFKQGNMTGVTIKSITLSGLASGGRVPMTADGIGDWTVGGTEKYETVVTLSGVDGPLEVGETSKLIGEDSDGHYTGAFLPVPQNLDESEGGHPVTVTVILTTADDDVTVTADIASGEWGKGKTNTYTLNYGSDTGFALTVTEWDEDGDTTLVMNETGMLPGIFSVSPTDYVRFSRGNLQATYNGSGYDWGFAAHQYDYIGNAPGNSTINNNGTNNDGAVVDLFGWSTLSKTHYGIYSSKNTADFAGEFRDWGTTIDATGTTWRTLSGGASGEWNYILNERYVNGGKGAGYSYTKVTSGSSITIEGKTYEGGLFIYPDGYTGATIGNTGAPDTWSAINAAGIVFLPAAGGSRDNSADFFGIGTRCCYWSSTKNGNDRAYHLDSQEANPAVKENQRYYGFSVRLVQRFPKSRDAVYIGGKYWATMNVGATTVAGSYSTCYGDYFAWGETEPYYSQMTISKTGTVTTVTFIWKTTPKNYKTKGYGSDYDNYKWGKPGGSGFTKYNNSDGKIVLDAEDDAVTHNWGPSWRMPTEEDFMALLYACTGSTGSESLTPSTLSSKNPEGGVYWLSADQTILMEYNGVAGCLFVDRSDPDKRVFFPAAGDISGTNFNNVGSSCFYWSRTRNTNDPCGVFRLKLNNSSIELKYNESRYNGFPIRPVHD